MSFVTEKDIIILKSNNIDYDKDIKIFIKEMIDYFISNWNEKYRLQLEEFKKDIDNKTIGDFNILIDNYPSYSGYEILSESFSFSKNIDKLSSTTLGLLGYFYGITLRV